MTCPALSTGGGQRLKTARGHLDGILKVVADEAYWPDVMTQIGGPGCPGRHDASGVAQAPRDACVAERRRGGPQQ